MKLAFDDIKATGFFTLNNCQQYFVNKQAADRQTFSALFKSFSYHLNHLCRQCRPTVHLLLIRVYTVFYLVNFFQGVNSYLIS